MSTSPNLVHNVRFDNTHWLGSPITVAIHGPADLPLALQRRAALEHLVKQGVPLHGLQLAGFDLTGAELPGAFFKDCDLTGADFTAADLSGVKLVNVRARNAKFDGANLSRAVLEAVDLIEASMADALLANAQIQGGSIIRADLSRIDGDGLVLANVAMNTQTIWTDADIVWTDLTRMGHQAQEVIDRTLTSQRDRATCRAFQGFLSDPASVPGNQRRRLAQEHGERVAAGV